MTKPKGRTPSLISGKTPKRIVVKRYAKCNRCKIKINAGEDCFGIPNTRIRFISTYKKFCKSCFNNIIAKTEHDLEAARNL
jgi:hypothetical protein